MGLESSHSLPSTAEPRERKRGERNRQDKYGSREMEKEEGKNPVMLDKKHRAAVA